MVLRSGEPGALLERDIPPSVKRLYLFEPSPPGDQKRKDTIFQALLRPPGLHMVIVVASHKEWVVLFEERQMSRPEVKFVNRS